MASQHNFRQQANGRVFSHPSDGSKRLQSHAAAIRDRLVLAFSNTHTSRMNPQSPQVQGEAISLT